MTQLGATIELVPPVKGLPDLVFTANAAVVMDGIALVANFRYPERQPEAAHYERSFRELWARGVIDAVRPMPEGVLLEGAGDCVWDPARQMFWTGYGPRSDKDAARVVAETYGVEALPLELVNPSFYHMDTALAPLPRGEVMYVPSAFSEEGLRQFYERVAPEQRIAAQRQGCRRLRRQCGEARRQHRHVVLQHGAAPAPGRGGLPSPSDVARHLSPQRRLGFLPDLATRPAHRSGNRSPAPGVISTKGWEAEAARGLRLRAAFISGTAYFWKAGITSLAKSCSERSASSSCIFPK